MLKLSYQHSRRRQAGSFFSQFAVSVCFQHTSSFPTGKWNYRWRVCASEQMSRCQWIAHWITSIGPLDQRSGENNQKKGGWGDWRGIHNVAAHVLGGRTGWRLTVEKEITESLNYTHTGTLRRNTKLTIKVLNGTLLWEVIRITKDVRPLILPKGAAHLLVQ